MQNFFADLHIHIGWSENKKPVKISASKNLNFFNIIHESYHRKGLDMIGIIDAQSPLVQAEIDQYLREGIITEHHNGGLKYQDLSIILGSEIEIKEEGRGAAHYLVFFPLFKDMLSFTAWLQGHMKNVSLSSQRLYTSTKELQFEVKRREGLFIPAHIFTPFKSVYGRCCNHMEEVMDLSMVDGVELGLSSDSYMADQIPELRNYTFLSNSDAHSVQKIGREYNSFYYNEPSFKELSFALSGQKNRRVASNYGLDPKLGKYYNSRCLECASITQGKRCDACGSSKVVRGVANRISEIATMELIPNEKRPPYIHQIPLEFIPKLGPKTLNKLLEHFGTEMNVLHYVKRADLLKVIPEALTDLIIAARTGQINLEKGGGGVFGKVLI